MPDPAARAAFAADALSCAPEVEAVTRRLMAVPSPNPPGDVRACAAEAAAPIRELAPEAEVSLHATSPEVSNLVARIAGAGPGKLLAFNGHLDTYPVNAVEAESRRAARFEPYQTSGHLEIPGVSDWGSAEYPVTLDLRRFERWHDVLEESI